MDKFTQSSQYFHRAPLAISFLSTHRSHGRNAPPNFSFGQSFFRFVDHILDEAFCVVADGLPVNVFHVWRIEVGATEDIRQIFFFCDRSDKGKSAKQVIALHDGKVFDIYFSTVVVWLGGDIAARCKIVALICLIETVHIDKIHMGDRRIADIGECQAFSIWHFIT